MNKGTRVEKFLLAFLIITLPVQLGKHFWPESAFIRGIRVDYLSPTIYLTDIVIVLLLIAASKLRLPVVKGRKAVVLALFVVLALVNVVFSTSPRTALFAWLRFAELGALFVYLKNTSVNAQDTIRRLLPIPILYSSIIGIMQFVREGSVGGLLYWIGERTFSISTPGIANTEFFGNVTLRPYATFSHPNALAGFMLVAFVVILKRNKKSEEVGKWKRAFLHTTFVLAGVTLLLTHSLSSWIAAALLVAAWAARSLGRKSAPIIITTSLVLAALVTMFPPEAQSVNLRQASFKTTIEMIKTHPATGVGLGSFVHGLDKMQARRSAAAPFLFYQPEHNIYLLAASELGIPLFAIFLWFLVLSGKKVNGKRTAGISLALLGILITGTFDHYWLTLHQNRLLFTIILALAWRKRNPQHN